MVWLPPKELNYLKNIQQLMIKRLFLPVFIFFTFYGNAQEAQVFSLEEAIRYAQENNIQVKIAKKNIEDADAQIIERRSVGLPQLSGVINFQRYLEVPVAVLPSQFEDIIRAGNGGVLPPDYSPKASFALKNNLNGQLSLQSLLFDGSYFTGLKAARLFKDYVGQELIATERQIRNQVIEAYLPPLIIDENLTILNKNITNLEKMLKETEATYEAGFVEQLDVDRLTLSLANLKTEVENLNRQKELVLNVLKFTMGFPVNQPIKVTDNLENLLVLATEDELTSDINYYSRPEYRVAETGIQLNELNIKVNKDGYLPSLSGFLNYQYGYQGNSLFGDDGFWVPTSVLGIQANIPIFDGFNKKAKIERAQIQMDIAKEQVKLLEQTITFEVQNARTTYLTALERVNSQEKNMKLAQRIFDTTQIKYRSGVGSSIEVTQAEQSLYQTQQNYIQARYDLLVAKQNLTTVLGQ